MRFVVNDQVVDEGARKATIRWVCQHDFATMKPFPKRWLFKAMFGRRAGWYGTDIFHFDERGKIIGKFSYANYGRRPAGAPRSRRGIGLARSPSSTHAARHGKLTTNVGCVSDPVEIGAGGRSRRRCRGRLH